MIKTSLPLPPRCSSASRRPATPCSARRARPRASVFCRPRLPSRPWRFPVSDTNQDKTARTPRLSIDQNATPAGESADTKPEAGEQHDSAANDFDEAMGLIKGTGAAIWSYAVRHPNTTLGAVAGFILAVLVLTLGLWDTLVIAFFVLIGAVIGQIRDGENGIVNFFGRLFSGR
ncbi:DUF2273 domain-containing protein [Collinsella sp. BIOML-A4]|nr:DUF2273 domain-containing protein [Collinsella sp. BIOML-A2]MZJ29545.1 DUF2273 domain-containing protein [Collinsella sp. BIOML-A3]MZJ32884.1 DUF2273 domain-containing protein [Collinsella sp. BIOML-A1]MZJ96597.1 DUF2273 domain-containing protein [Collinsella sp. BIOML-A6]MZK30403.1 DUF2273 domain-containing protein [Collinsella sp. BIOML-A5]MZK65903.1 DUF2273 domain-containing protein [Collinsella sp. BIOML-A4]